MKKQEYIHSQILKLFMKKQEYNRQEPINRGVQGWGRATEPPTGW
jgi:hypothetical protein